MNTTTITKRDAVKSARAFLKAQGEYSKNFKIYLESLEPLSEKRFWEMVDIYRQLIIDRLDRSNITELAADELFRLPHAEKFCLSGGTCHKSPYTFDIALRFANDWAKYKSALYQPLFEIVENRSDDSYGDLIDNLTLLGSKFYARCLKKDFSNGVSFENAAQSAAIVRATGNGMETAALFAKFVQDGENYNGMMLRDAAEKFFAFHVRK